MNVVEVSYFSSFSNESRTRRVPFPRTSPGLLKQQIIEAMLNGEFFACYHHPKGGVVAIDYQGVTVQV
jgi:hypothetical protein